ncbi:MAG: hypothetical protein HRF49_07655 [bacterium]|jgi:hypothetical protein
MNKEQVEILVKLKDEMSKTLKNIDSNAKRSMQSVRESTMNAAKAYAWLAAKVFVVIQALRGLGRFISSSIADYNAEADAINKLNAAMQAHGVYTERGSKKLQRFASEVQRLTTIGDDAVINLSAQIAAITGLGEDALPTAAKAAIQLSKAYGVDLNAAGTLLAKTLISDVNALARYGVQVDMTQDAQGRLNQLLANSTAGWVIAEQETKTFSGAMAQLKNSWGDFKEVVGGWIAESPMVQDALKNIRTSVDELNAVVTGEGDKGNLGKAIEVVKEAWAQALPGLLSVWETLKAEFLDIFGETIDWFKENWPLILATIKVVGAAISEWWSAWGPTLTNIFQLTWNTVKVIVKVALDTILGIVKVAMQLITGDWRGAWNTILETSKSIWNSIKQFISDQLNVIKNIVKNALDWIHGKWLWLKDKLVGHSVVPDMVDAIVFEFDRMGVSIKALSEKNLAGVLDVHRKFAAELYDILTSVPTAEELLIDEALMGGPPPLRSPMSPPSGRFAMIGRVAGLINSARIRGPRRLVGAAPADSAGGPGAPSFGSNFMRSITEQIRDPQFGSALGGALTGGGSGLIDLLGGVGGGAVSSAVSGIASLGAFAGPLGALAGSLFTGLFSGLRKLFGSGRKPQEQPKPVDVRVVNSGDIAMALLNAVKGRLLGAAAPGNASLAAQLHGQAARVGAM